MEKYKDMELISFIPARGGSKRLPKKNIKIIAGKPMVAWTIEASLKSKYVNRTFVSTEDPEIKEIALKYGAEVHDRPAKYAEDKGIELMGGFQHFKEMIWGSRHRFIWCAFLNPCYVMRTAKHIDEAYEILRAKQGMKVGSVRKQAYYTNHFFKKIDSNGQIQFAYKWDKKELATTGTTETYLNEALITIAPFLSTGFDFTFPGTLAYICSEEDCIDVDSPLDFRIAEILLKERIAKEKKNEQCLIGKN